MSEERISELESRLVHLEDALDKLDSVVADQQQRIMDLEKVVELLTGRYRDIAETVDRLAPHQDAPPPHY